MLGAAAGGESMNKKSMKLFKDRAAERRASFLRPHEEIITLPGAKDVRVFPLGPPRDQICSKRSIRRAARSSTRDGAAQLRPRDLLRRGARERRRPAARRRSPRGMCIASEDAVEGPASTAQFFSAHYGAMEVAAAGGRSRRSARRGARRTPEWRRIDNDWLYSAEQLALDMNEHTNNASLVLAFELGKDGKVLLFAGGRPARQLALLGQEELEGRRRRSVTTKDLLARTVLYKVGHHGSHNATLNGKRDRRLRQPRRGWRRAITGREFTAMITAVRAWAETQKGWDHPLKAIKDALLKKASGRVFQTDTDFEQMTKADNSSQIEWSDFQSRVEGERLFFDYTVRA